VRETNYAIGETCGTYEVAKWGMNSSRSFRNPGFTQDDRHPVVCVNWGDAKVFAAWLSKKTGRDYRLLSESEPRVCHACGHDDAVLVGNIDHALAGQLLRELYLPGRRLERRVAPAHRPGRYLRARPLGLYQVHGNVWDWTEDCWRDNYQGAPTDGSAWTTGDCSRRVARGGSWVVYPRYLRSADRVGRPDPEPSSHQGFRLARTLNP
jgi:formylglycine-generating enzyme required for sulfatase activity